MNKDVKLVYNKLEKTEGNKQSYIDLSNRKIQKENDLIETCNIFRDPRYETFRVFYMKNNMIVGQEIVTSRIPNAVIIFSTDKFSKNYSVRIYEKMKNRINRLKADGYYLVHNHTSESAKPSQEDMEITKNFVANVNGFLGHIVLGNKDKYSIIEKNSKDLILVPKEKILKNDIVEKMEQKLKDNVFYDLRISNRDELVALVKKIQNNKEYSIAVLTDNKCNIRMVVDIPNRMFNQNTKNLNGFFKNLARNSGSIRVFIGTQDVLAYNEILKHQRYGTIKDMVYFDKKRNLIKTEKITNSQDLFDKEKSKKVKRNKDVR